jgi:hypothetical protein
MLRKLSCPACEAQNGLVNARQVTLAPSLATWRTHRVPDLQLDLFPVDVDHSGTELDADSQVMDRLRAGSPRASVVLLLST